MSSKKKEKTISRAVRTLPVVELELDETVSSTGSGSDPVPLERASKVLPIVELEIADQKTSAADSAKTA